MKSFRCKERDRHYHRGSIELIGFLSRVMTLFKLLFARRRKNYIFPCIRSCCNRAPVETVCLFNKCHPENKHRFRKKKMAKIPVTNRTLFMNKSPVAFSGVHYIAVKWRARCCNNGPSGHYIVSWRNPSAIDTIQAYLYIHPECLISTHLHTLNRAVLSNPSIVESFRVWFKLYWDRSFHSPLRPFYLFVSNSVCHRSHVSMRSK